VNRVLASLKNLSSQFRIPNSFYSEISSYLIIFIISLAIRSYDLAGRAMHHDESLHAFHSWKLFEGLGLIHNPMMHGPLQMELTAGIFFLLGDSDATARLLYVLMGSVP
jgi:predicted membrane-bound mannosyltransferase